MKLTNRLVRSKAILHTLFGLLMSVGTAWSDDIDVYTHGSNGANLPNVLFVFDISRSMDSPTGGNNQGQNKLETLKDTFTNILQESRGRVNVGLSVYGTLAHGIQWPISDLETEAQTIDSAIEAGVTVEQVVNSLVNNYSPAGKTATVDALYEATRYFRGEPVWVGGALAANHHEPKQWAGVTDGYQNGSLRAAHPASYTPQDAFYSTTTTVPGAMETCTKYDGGNDECVGKTVISCDAHVPATTETQTSQQCTLWDNSCQEYGSSQQCTGQSEQCTQYDITGTECLSTSTSCNGYETVNSCIAWNNNCVGGYEEVTETITSGGYQRCTYQAEPTVSPSYHWDGADYVSPISVSCQGNYVILLSDGAPSETHAVSPIQSLTGQSCQDLSFDVFNQSGYHYGNCGPELANFLANEDQVADIDNSFVNLYTIGFDLAGTGGAESQAYLQQLAESGGGNFLAADDADGLTDAFRGIIDAIAGDQATFAGLSLEVDGQSASHGDRTYLNVFGPSGTRSWRGNTKGYFLSPEGLRDVDGVLAIENVDGVNTFKDTARSFWSADPDGGAVSSGGVNSKLSSSTRKLYTYASDLSPDGANLSNVQHRLDPTNAALKLEYFGGTVNDQQSLTELIDWVRSAPMGDPLHTSPRTLQYENKRVLFSTTNQGFLHAFDATAPVAQGDASGGEEIFAFIPQALLPNLHHHRQNKLDSRHIYGLDGGLSVWHADENYDGIVNGQDRAMLFFGMRRGGDSYFAVDVSDINNPKLEWQINPFTAGFDKLGQTWSKPALVDVNWRGSPRKVLVFSAGYDPASDLETQRTPHSKGNAIYVVDPLTGQMLWSVGGTLTHTNYAAAMQYAIPSDIRVIDSNFNGLADRMYVGDLGGQVWRVTLDEDRFGFLNGAEVDVFANLANAGPSEYRKFFYPPTVFIENGIGEQFIGVAIGSGDRSTPLEAQVTNRVYLLRDGVALSDYSTEELTLNESELDNLTHADQAAADSHNVAVGTGWRIDLQGGEKALSPIVAYQGELLFTTYSPAGDVQAALDQCETVGSIHRSYFVSQRDARSTTYLGEDASDPQSPAAPRYIEEEAPGIPSSPKIVFPPDGEGPDIYVNTDVISRRSADINRVFWHSQSTFDE